MGCPLAHRFYEGPGATVVTVIVAPVCDTLSSAQGAYDWYVKGASRGQSKGTTLAPLAKKLLPLPFVVSGMFAVPPGATATVFICKPTAEVLITGMEKLWISRDLSPVTTNFSPPLT